MSVHNGALIYTYLYQILLKSIVQGSESVPILAAIHIPHMRVVGVKRALHWSPGQPSGSFLTQINRSRCRPCGVAGDALASSKRSGKSTGFAGHLYHRGQRTRVPIEIAAHGDVWCGCLATHGSSPFIDCGFDARRTSHPVAVPRAA